jgi:hypothetical protein
VALDETYGFGMRDCVTFARDVAEYCGLEVGGLLGVQVDFFPYELLVKLHELNEDRVVAGETRMFLEDDPRRKKEPEKKSVAPKPGGKKAPPKPSTMPDP